MSYKVFDAAESPRRLLEELGLDERELREAVMRGQLASSSCSALAPKTASGFYAWAETVSALREALVRRGWVAECKGNFEVVVEPDGRWQIVVSSGNNRTGLGAMHVPSTRNSRGPHTRAAVEINTLQLSLFGDARGAARELRGPTTWVLLYYQDGHEVRAELSLPSDIDDGGRIDAWQERNILAPIPLGGSDLSGLEDVEELRIEVGVQRKVD
jgi:hypothetical protein